MRRAVLAANPRPIAELAAWYSISRALAAAFLLLTIIHGVFAPSYIEGWMLGTTALAATSLYRMYQCGVRLAKEVLHSFIRLDGPHAAID